MVRTSGDETTPSATLTREDDRVGEAGSAPAGGGRQTPEQAAIIGTGAGGRSDGERNEGWAGDRSGRPPVALGGSSGGHADRKRAGDDREVADGHDKVEKEQS